jgi:bifunctional DNA-binding transcriptional regulator/antitoxin component of YhaV-PrlF toxin-antitoxin module
MPRPENDQTGKRKLNLVGKKTFAVSIPIEIIRQLNLEKGDELLVRRQGDRIVIEQTKERVL